MKWTSLNLWVPILLLLVSRNVTAQSPAQPIKAKQRQLSYEIQSDGSRVLKSEQEGVFYRTSSGAAIRTMGDRSTFMDAQGDMYEIDHNKKFARLVAHGSGTPLHEVFKNMSKDPPSNILYEAVNGLNCAVVPMYSGNKFENPESSGKVYLYLPYGLEVKSESTNPEDSLTIRELYDIEVAEPDPALVRIPEGYFIDNTLQQR